MQLRVRPVRQRSELSALRELLTEYLSLQVDNYPDPASVARAHRHELAALPGRFARPDGDLFLGSVRDLTAGCVALQGHAVGIGELKRLYVREEFRGFGLGRLLTQTVVDAARDTGYSRLRLDVHVSRAPAISLYESLGFIRVEPWTETPFDLVFMEKTL